MRLRAVWMFGTIVAVIHFVAFAGAVFALIQVSDAYFDRSGFAPAVVGRVIDVLSLPLTAASLRWLPNVSDTITVAIAGINSAFWGFSAAWIHTRMRARRLRT
jgi:hypothetical protein